MDTQSASNLVTANLPAFLQQDSGTSQGATNAVLASFSTLGPLISRFVAVGMFPEPLFTVTLQRDSIEIGGNVGALNVGQLPANVQNGSLTWVPIRRYTVDQGGLRPPSNSPHEVRWNQFRRLKISQEKSRCILTHGKCSWTMFSWTAYVSHVHSYPRPIYNYPLLSTR